MSFPTTIWRAWESSVAEAADWAAIGDEIPGATMAIKIAAKILVSIPSPLDYGASLLNLDYSVSLLNPLVFDSNSAPMLRLIFLAIAVAASLVGSSAACAQSAHREPRVGDTYEITMIRESSQQRDGASSGSSYDRDTIIERVIGVRAGGLELEYDLPKAATADERASVWQFPARVFMPHGGPLQLLNRAELEARIDRWLKAAKWTRAVCGHMIFTWNAFRIECDPQSVIKAVEAFDLRSADVREGGLYQESGARAVGTLARKTGSADGATFAVELEADPDAVRRARAESDVAVGEIMHKPVTLESALRERAKEAVSGTISVTFDTDSDGNVRRRTRVTKLQIKKADGRSETEVVTQTLERRLISERRRGRASTG